MKQFSLVPASVVLALTLINTLQGADRTVVVPRDGQPFKVGVKDIVRLTGTGIAGSRIEAKVEGPAKVEGANDIFERAGGSTVIGNSIKEFEIKPTGKGKVKVKITVTPPQPGANPKVTDYEFEVE